MNYRFELYKQKTLGFIYDHGGKVYADDIRLFLIQQGLRAKYDEDVDLVYDIIDYCSDHNLLITEDDIKNPPCDNTLDKFEFVKNHISDEAYNVYPERIDIIKYLADSTFRCREGIVFKNEIAQILYQTIIENEGIEREEDIYSFGAALNCVRNLKIDDIEHLYENDDYIQYHHGYGTFLRNSYVYPKSGLFLMADDGSEQIFNWIISIIKPHKILADILKRKTGSSNHNVNIDLKVRSVLKEYGYTVGRKGLSPREREKILVDVLHKGGLEKEQIIGLLRFFVRYNGSRSNMEKAVSDWTSDIRFLENY